MPYSITKYCVQCNDCISKCPTDAIKVTEDGEYWIDPTLCNQCEGYSPEPLCLMACPVNSPVPLQAKKGRNKAEPRPITNLDLFLNGKTNTFASAIVIWQLSNILAQRQSLPWEVDESGYLFYQRAVNQGRGTLMFRITEHGDGDFAEPLKQESARAAIAELDIRATCLNLICAAHTLALERPWEQEFTINDQQIERYLGLEKRKDLSKLAKLTLIKNLMQQICKVLVTIEWPRQGKIPGFSVPEGRLWQLTEMQHHVQEDDLGCKHLTGLTFKIKAGEWARYFLNQEGYRHRTAFYQYGSLPKSVLTQAMSIWQQHEGAVRIMLWLLFKTKMGKDQRITVQTLMRIAYGEERLMEASSQSSSHKRMMRTFESDLEALASYGLKPLFDLETYPVEIQPLWAKLADLPDDPEAALEFWLEDGGSDRRLTDGAPRGKWNRLMNARLSGFDLPEDWEQKLSVKRSSKQSKAQGKTKVIGHAQFVGSQVIRARQQLQLSQRELANRIGKSQSWVRDVEKGRFQPNIQDQTRLHQILKAE
ncbi:MAG: helix-turn-helix domain-containing protein [Oscillatoriales cyanobacterium RM2_1_1]|nr:helix-turn-helix domain-containing protein [Oscillatoriales cyanobacterium SM2_3_0]NJO45421.1 helix-turn-helix domain-containing protein [Oscillatoriales cyanobacterium RM2_1_1]